MLNSKNRHNQRSKPHRTATSEPAEGGARRLMSSRVAWLATALTCSDFFHEAGFKGHRAAVDLARDFMVTVL